MSKRTVAMVFAALAGLTAMLAVGSLWLIESSEDRFGVSCGLAFACFDPPHIGDFTIGLVNTSCPWQNRVATLAARSCRA